MFRRFTSRHYYYYYSYSRWPSSAAQRSLYCILNTTRLRQSRKRTSKFSAFGHLQGEVRDKRVRTYKQKEVSTITGKLQTHTFSHFFNDTHLHPNTIVIKDSLLEHLSTRWKICGENRRQKSEIMLVLSLDSIN